MALNVENLSYSFGSTPVLRNLSFVAPEGKLTVLLGRNGCGKSTLLKVIAGTLPLQSGSVTIAGQELTNLKGSARAALIGYLPQFHQTVFPFSVADVVLTGRAAYVLSTPSATDHDKARLAMAQVGIEHLAARPYTELSGGERQLVMIARVLAQTPRVILLDEPASHLDLANQQRLLGLLSDITATGVTVVAVLHEPNMAFLNTDSVIFMKQGEVVTPAAGDHHWSPAFIREIYGISAATLPFRDKGIVVPLYDIGGEDAA